MHNENQGTCETHNELEMEMSDIQSENNEEEKFSSGKLSPLDENPQEESNNFGTIGSLVNQAQNKVGKALKGINRRLMLP